MGHPGLWVKHPSREMNPPKVRGPWRKFFKGHACRPETVPPRSSYPRLDGAPARPESASGHNNLHRPLTPEQDQLLQKEFMRRNDPGGNVFVLFRSTGMRSGECVDLSYDCLRSTGPNLCAIHVPLGKLNAWSLSMPSPVISCTGCGSSASLILCPPMDGCWRDQETRLQSWFNSAISCTWSATRSHFQQI